MIAMAVYDTAENKRTAYTRATLECITNTVDLSRHRLYIIDNASCEETKELLARYFDTEGISILYNNNNIGTAKAINQAWRHRKEGEHLIKMDNDVVIHFDGWVDELEQCINVGNRMSEPIGILGLKRKDLIESPFRLDFYQSKLIQLPHVNGERWWNVEVVNHVMGTCQMYNSRLIDEIGGLYQMDGIYGFDDSLAAVRCQLAGFQNAFLNYINIDHIDDGGTDYQKWKENYVAPLFAEYEKLKVKMVKGEAPIRYSL